MICIGSTKKVVIRNLAANGNLGQKDDRNANDERREAYHVDHHAKTTLNKTRQDAIASRRNMQSPSIASRLLAPAERAIMRIHTAYGH